MDLPTFVTFMIMWMLLFFGILIIFLTYRHNRHAIDLHHQETMAALERGLEIPPIAPQGDNHRQPLDRVYYLQRGLLFTLLGLSLMAALGANVGEKSALWGLPLTAFGITYLILYFLGAKEQRP
jgi:hypothetical protein